MKSGFVQPEQQKKMASDFWTWNWTYVCPTGLKPWDATDKFLSPCFQEICLQLPMLTLFAILSSYHFGHQTILVRRNGMQRFLISIRILVAFLIAAMHFYKMFELVVSRAKILPIDVVLMGFQIVAWTVHIGK